jgi:hypothetical protein
MQSNFGHHTNSLFLLQHLSHLSHHKHLCSFFFFWLHVLLSDNFTVTLWMTWYWDHKNKYSQRYNSFSLFYKIAVFIRITVTWLACCSNCHRIF